MTYAIGTAGQQVRAFIEASSLEAAEAQMQEDEVCIMVGMIVGGSSISSDGKTIIDPTS